MLTLVRQRALQTGVFSLHYTNIAIIFFYLKAVYYY